MPQQAQQRWEREPSAAAQQVRRVYGHKQKLGAWLASPAADSSEALLDGIAALCQDQVCDAPNWPPGKAAPTAHCSTTAWRIARWRQLKKARAAGP